MVCQPPDGRGWAPLCLDHRKQQILCQSLPETCACFSALQEISVGAFLQACHHRVSKFLRPTETFQSQTASVCPTSEIRTWSQSLEFIELFAANLTTHELLSSFDMSFWRYLLVQGNVNHSWGTKNIDDTLWCFPHRSQMFISYQVLFAPLEDFKFKISKWNPVKTSLRIYLLFPNEKVTSKAWIICFTKLICSNEP